MAKKNFTISQKALGILLLVGLIFINVNVGLSFTNPLGSLIILIVAIFMILR
jgi:hypothetical protein